jgi:hypothetical protein
MESSLKSDSAAWVRICKNCRQTKPLSVFRVKGGTLKNLDVWCSSCRHAKQKNVLTKPTRERRVARGVLSRVAYERMEAKAKEAALRSHTETLEMARRAKANPKLAKGLRSADTALKLLRTYPFPPELFAWRDGLRKLLDDAVAKLRAMQSAGVTVGAEHIVFWYDVDEEIKARFRFHLADYPGDEETIPFRML